MGKNFSEIKPIVEQILALSIQLLKFVDNDERERESFFEYLKKMPIAKF